MPTRPTVLTLRIVPLLCGLFCLFLLTSGCQATRSSGAGDLQIRSVPSFGSESNADLLASLSLEEKAAQLVFVRAHGLPMHPQNPEFVELLRYVEELGVGGIVLFDSDLDSIAPLVDSLQQRAELPLLVTSDLESGLAFRVRRGSVQLPSAMAIGATGDVEASRFAGDLTAREALAVGIDWIFAPVVDVNTDPENPVIGIRSFGEDPTTVAQMARAFVEGAQSEGVLTTAKHFPGHGDTSIDSHESLPTLEVDRERLDRVELVPFRALIDANVDSVMTGHLAVPAIDHPGTPASLPNELTSTLLREELGFEGLIVTDAIEMEATGGLWPGGAAVQALVAGADVVLLPEDPDVAVATIARSVREGILTEDRLDRSVLRLLDAKRRSAKRGADQSGSSSAASLASASGEIGSPADFHRARQIAEASITLVRDRSASVPIHVESNPKLLHLVLQDSHRFGSRARIAGEAIVLRLPETQEVDVPPVVPGALVASILLSAAEADEIVLSSASRNGELSDDQAGLITELQQRGHTPILLSLGSPYLLKSAPDIPTYLVSYGSYTLSQEAAVAALFGEIPIRGRLPVTLVGTGPNGAVEPLAARGSGQQREARPMALDLQRTSLPDVDRAVESFVEAGAFPGAVVVAAQGGKIVHLRAYGRQTYDAESPRTTTATIYDLASLTKVIATTTMAMIAVDEGRLDLETRAVDVLPKFTGPQKSRVTVRHLLTHSSGIDWWAPLYEEHQGWEEYIQQIVEMELVAEPGTKTLYSDLGLILLGELLQRALGEPFDTFARRRVFEPLGMIDTGFNPPPSQRDRIAPTEIDSTWRKTLLHGQVHDENAAALGGIAPHAGLFSTAEDLARFGQMITNGGVYGHRRVVERDTLEEFRKPAGIVPDSTRAIGWDTKSEEGSSAGSLFSPSSFGHTGFTGTSIWFDPERELFLVILTNRVHPTRENKQIRQARPAIADALIRSLEPDEPSKSP